MRVWGDVRRDQKPETFCLALDSPICSKMAVNWAVYSPRSQEWFMSLMPWAPVWWIRALHMAPHYYYDYKIMVFFRLDSKWTHHHQPVHLQSPLGWDRWASDWSVTCSVEQLWQPGLSDSVKCNGGGSVQRQSLRRPETIIIIIICGLI